jgi:hypothetical protein
LLGILGSLGCPASSEKPKSIGHETASSTGNRTFAESTATDFGGVVSPHSAVPPEGSGAVPPATENGAAPETIEEVAAVAPKLSSAARLEATHAVVEWLGMWVLAIREGKEPVMRPFYANDSMIKIDQGPTQKTLKVDDWIHEYRKLLGDHSDLEVDRIVVNFGSDSPDEPEIHARLSPAGTPNERSVEAKFELRRGENGLLKLARLSLKERPSSWWKVVAAGRPGYAKLDCPPVSLEMQWRSTAVPGEINGMVGDPPSHGYMTIRCLNDESLVMPLPLRGNISRWSAPKLRESRIIGHGNADGQIQNAAHEITFELRSTQLKVDTKVIYYDEMEEMVDGEVIESVSVTENSDAAALVVFPSTPSLTLDCQGSTAKPGAGQKSTPCLAKLPRMTAKP